MSTAYSELAPLYHLLFPAQLARLEFLSALAGAPPALVVDAGSGTGEYVAALQRQGYDACGVELDAQLQARALRRYPELGPPPAGTGRLLHGDLLELCDLIRGPAALAYCTGTALAELGSLEAVREGLAQLWDLTRPQGCVLLGVANFDHLQAEAQRCLAAAAELDEEVTYVDLLRGEPRRDSPQLGSVSADEIRLSLAPLSATREDGARIELERWYVWPPGPAAEPPDRVGLTLTLRTPEELVSSELDLLCLTRERLAACLPAAATAQWFGGYADEAWTVDSAQSVAVLRAQ